MTLIYQGLRQPGPATVVRDQPGLQAQLSEADADFAVKEIIDAMIQALARGQRIEIRGFGSFC